MNYFDLYDIYMQPGSAREQEKHESIFEQTADRIIKPLARSLQALHGDVLDFETLTLPLAYLAIYQCAPGRHAPVGIKPGLQVFNSYKALASVRPGDQTHALMKQVLASEHPTRETVRWTGCLSEPKDAAPELQIEPRTRTAKIGVSFGTSFGERLQFFSRLPGRIKFLRGVKPMNAETSRTLRELFLEKLQAEVAGEQDELVRSVVFYLALVMPTFLLEDFNRYANLARRQAAGLRSLVIGTEFQRKPDIAILIALMKHQGKRIVGIQHGGGYGQTDPNWWERAERRFCDHYRTWGYRLDERDQPLPSIKLSRQALKAKRAGKVKSYSGLQLRILLAVPYVSEELECSLYSPPYQSQVAALESTLQILGPLLERDCRLTIRLHPKNRGASFIPALSLAKHPKVQFSTGVRGSIAEDSRNYTALIFSSPQATGIAECLAADCNFYVAASPNFFWIRDEAALQYKEMIRSGLWLTREDELEQFLESGFAPMTHRQRVFRHSFAKAFACHSDNYLSDWAEMLKHA